MAVLTIPTTLILVHGKTRNLCWLCSSTGASVDISWHHYHYAWRDSDDVIFVPYIPPIEGPICCLVFGRKESPHVQLRHCACILAVKTLFKYNLKETIHIYYLIKQYLNHEKTWTNTASEHQHWRIPLKVSSLDGHPCHRFMI